MAGQSALWPSFGRGDLSWPHRFRLILLRQRRLSDRSQGVRWRHRNPCSPLGIESEAGDPNVATALGSKLIAENSATTDRDGGSDDSSARYRFSGTKRSFLEPYRLGVAGSEAHIAAVTTRRNSGIFPRAREFFRLISRKAVEFLYCLSRCGARCGNWGGTETRVRPCHACRSTPGGLVTA